MNRRLFLRTAGSTLLLPFLPSVALADETPPKRVLLYFVSNGLAIGRTATIDPFNLLDELSGFEARRSVVSGLRNKAVDTNSDHELCTPSLLTDVRLDPGTYGEGPFTVGTSFDQVAARQVGLTTPFPSMQLGVRTAFEPITTNGNTYSTRLSWASEQVPLPMTVQPQQLFDQMFGGFDPAATAEERARRLRLRTSVLDSVLDQVGSLQSRLGREDQRKLDSYTSSVRDLETRLEALANDACPIPEEPGTGLGYRARIARMVDLMVLALQCDHTRILTFMSSPSSSYQVYGWLGQSTNHHVLSHQWLNDTSSRDQLVAIQRWHVAVVNGLCERLANTPTSDGLDLLSHTLVVLTSEFTEPRDHDAHPLPFVLLGGEAGGVLQGRHIRRVGRPHSNLLRSFIQYLGADPTGFGSFSNATLSLA